MMLKDFKRFFFRGEVDFSLLLVYRSGVSFMERPYGKVERAKWNLGFIVGNYTHFLSNPFLRSASVLLNVFYTEIHFIFSIFVSMSICRSIYIMYLYSFLIFSLFFIVINHIMSLKQTYLFLVHFLEYLLL